jgi:hypothetical protein
MAKAELRLADLVAVISALEVTSTGTATLMKGVFHH